MINSIRKKYIPKNTPYCYEVIEVVQNGRKIKPCKNWCLKYNEKYKCKMEYCKYLRKFLEIQDQVKDCWIGLDE